MTPNSIFSLFGVPAFLFLAWLCSANRKCINWRLLGWGMAMQLALGCFIFNVPAGRRFFAGVFANGTTLGLE
ncbi:MAG: Na+ dependent nucleoside transporter N-terminal domain-containing protein [Verrucomicrobiota bacterium]